MEIKAMIKQGLCAGLMWLGLAAGASAQTTIVEYIHTDALGSPVAVTDASGAVIPGQAQVYEPYGAPISHGPSDGPGFTGHVEDSATGLTYMQQRYFDPSIGRFLSVDPIRTGTRSGRGMSRYAYANNNPISSIDPDGRWTVAIGGGGNASAIVGVSGSSQYTFSFPSASPRTWKMGVLIQGGGQAGTDIGAGVNAAISWSAADSAEEMAGTGPGASVGGSINVPGAGPSIGYEQSLCENCNPTYTLTLGAALKALPFEIHSSVSGAFGSTILGGGSKKTPTVTVGQPTQVKSSTESCETCLNLKSDSSSNSNLEKTSEVDKKR